MIWAPIQPAKFFVVDASPEDYQSLVDVAQRDSAEIQFFATGRDALRADSYDSPAMWIVNMRLPDMDGSELQGILRSRGCRGTMALVGDEYTVEDELAARHAGADVYLAKPALAEMILATRSLS